MNLEVEAFCAGCTLFSVFISTSYSKDSRINVKYKLSIAMADWNKEIKQLSGHNESQLWDSNPLTHFLPYPCPCSSHLFFCCCSYFSFAKHWRMQISDSEIERFDDSNLIMMTWSYWNIIPFYYRWFLYFLFILECCLCFI